MLTHSSLLSQMRSRRKQLSTFCSSLPLTNTEYALLPLDNLVHDSFSLPISHSSGDTMLCSRNTPELAWSIGVPLVAPLLLVYKVHCFNEVVTQVSKNNLPSSIPSLPTNPISCPKSRLPKDNVRKGPLQNRALQTQGELFARTPLQPTCFCVIVIPSIPPFHQAATFKSLVPHFTGWGL